MKNLIIASALLTSLLMATLASAQTGDSTPKDPAPADRITERITAARNQYTMPECASTEPPDFATLAQFPNRRRGPMYPRAGYPRPTYAGMYRPAVNGRHVLIGALIGFGIGAAVVAKSHGTAGAAVAIGTIGAGIGAGMGAGMPSYYARSRYRRGSRSDEQDELASRSDPSKPNSPGRAESSAAPIGRSAAPLDSGN